MGGLATAAALRRVGIDVTVYEQASQFARLGAGIQVGCNAMKVLRGLGLEARMRSQSFYPRSWNNRDWRTGEVKFDMIFGESAEQKFGAPYLLAHRGDLHAALASAVPDEHVRLSQKLVGLDDAADGIRLSFANGATATADAVVGADGVHSIVRDILFGESPVRFTGRIAYRTTYPAALLNGEKIDDCTKWWGEDRHIVIYYVKPDRSEVYLVTSQPEPEFRIESWSAKGDVRALRAAFEGFDRQVEKVLAARQYHAARRRLPSDDALHGAGRGHGDRGRRRAVALSGRRRPRWRCRCLSPVRSDAQGAHLARPGYLAEKHLAQAEDRCRLGLWL
jgi:salicylate hydroxylase/6-hydroxynicotinate 3-monooxygenase